MDASIAADHRSKALGNRALAARTRHSRWLDRKFAAITALPTTLVMLAIFGVPLLLSAFLSFRGWSLEQSLAAGSFVGADNYTDLLTDPDFITSLVLTLCYTAAAVAAEMLIGLGIALALNVDLPLIGFFRTVLVVPMMMTPIVAAFCWRLLLDPGNGVINYWIGQHIVWLGQPHTAQISVTIVNIWQNAPYVAILLLAGLRSLPHEPMEAASIDGAGRIADLLARHPAAVAILHPGGAAAAHDLRVPHLRQRLRDDQRRPGERHHGAVDVHLPRIVPALRPQPRRRRLLADAADLPVPVCHVHHGRAAPERGMSAHALALPVARARAASRRRWRRRLFPLCMYAVLITLAAAFLFPLVWVVGLSFKTQIQVFTIPPLWVWSPTLANYASVLRDGGFPGSFRQQPRHLHGGGGAVDLRRRSGRLRMARFPFRGRSVLFISLLLMRMLPPIAVLVPMYVLFSKLGLTTTRLSVVLAYATFSLPLVVWIMRGVFEDLPRELEESAWVDGASRYAAFRHVVLPLIRPGLVAATILCLQLAWNDFLFAAVLTNNATRTLPVLMAAYAGTDTGIDWGGMTASGVLVVLPVLLFSFLAQRHLVAGLSSGAVKG